MGSDHGIVDIPPVTSFCMPKMPRRTINWARWAWCVGIVVLGMLTFWAWVICGVTAYWYRGLACVLDAGAILIRYRHKLRQPSSAAKPSVQSDWVLTREPKSTTEVWREYDRRMDRLVADQQKTFKLN